MPALVHTTFRVSNAKQFKESFEEKSEHGVGGYIPLDMMFTPDPNEPNEIEWNKTALTATEKDNMNVIPYYALNDQMYLFIGRVSAWNQFDTPDGSSDPNINENNPPYPVDSMKDSHFNHWDDMIAAKKVSAGEVSHVIKRERADEIKEGIRNWTRGKRYDTYDDRADNLFDDDILIHTVNERFRVYKCIKQGIGTFEKIAGVNYDPGTQGADTNYNNGVDTLWCWSHVSRRQPLATNPETPGVTEDFMEVGDQFNDGYQWKYYYTIDAGEALKFVTTSYIPVRTIRRENGQRIDDYSDQWKVETNSIPGGILNVNVGKTPIEGTDGTVFGYEFTGGGAGYVQFAAEGDGGANKVQMQYEDVNNLLKFKITDWATNVATANTTWPDPDAGNRFDFTVGSSFLNAAAAAGTAALDELLKGYGVVIKAVDPAVNADIVKRYVYPIQAVAATGAWPTMGLELTIDDTWISQRKADARMDASIEGLSNAGLTDLQMYDVSIEIHPKVNIKANHQSSTASDKTNSFEAFAVCEPFFDIDPAAETYHQGYPGRVIDVRVTNPGMYHYRIDNYEYGTAKFAAEVAGRPTAWTAALTGLNAGQVFPAGLVGVAAEDASVFPSIPPVGGHGADPTNEFGGFNVMINARFEGTEADEFTVGNEFRKIGILKNPLAYANTADDYNDLTVREELNSLEIGPQEYDKLFRGYKTDQCYRINLEDDSKLTDAPGGDMIFFEPDMEIGFFANSVSNTSWPSMSIYDGINAKTWVDGGTYGDDNAVTPTVMETSCIATARLVDHDTINKRIRVIKPRGDFFTVLQGTPAGTDVKIEVRSLQPHKVEGKNVFAMSLQTSNTAEEPGMLPGSGKILYVENRSMVSRSSNQTEDLKISIQF